MNLSQNPHLHKTDVIGSAFCPKDLMIGNFVNRKYYNPHPTNPSWELEKCEVVGIRQNSVIIKMKGGSHSNHDYWEGIHITGYMLEEELNFDCVNRPRMVFRKYHNEENSDSTYIQLKEVGTNPIWVISFHNRWTVNPFTVEIEFLHQLQNLHRLASGLSLS